MRIKNCFRIRESIQALRAGGGDHVFATYYRRVRPYLSKFSQEKHERSGGQIYTSDIYYYGVDTSSSSFKMEQCDYPDPPE